MSDIFDHITRNFINEKRASAQPLRLQRDYGEASKIADLYAQRKAEEIEAEEWMEVDSIMADELEADELEADEVTDLFADDLEADDMWADEEISEKMGAGWDMDSWERMADFDKTSRVKSHKHNTPKEVKESYEEQKKNFGAEWAKYEGAMTSKGLSPERINKNTKGKGGKGSGGGLSPLDNLNSKGKGSKPSKGGLSALDRLASEDEIIDDLGLDRFATDFLGGDEDSGSYMSRQNLREMDDQLDMIIDHIEEHEDDHLEDWVEDKISHGHAAITDVARHLGYGDDHLHEDDEIIDDLDDSMF